MTSPLRVLLVEDSPDDASLVVRQLRRSGFDVTYDIVDTGPATEAALDRGVYDVVICDYSLPRFNGLEALQLVRQRDADMPFILVSAAIGEDLAVAAMKAGANEYVMKGNLSRLGVAVDREVREAEHRRARRRAEAALAERNAELERRLVELRNLNTLFQQHLTQWYAAVQVYIELQEDLETVQEKLTMVVQRMRDEARPDLTTLPPPPPPDAG